MTGKIRGWERQILVTAVRLAPLKLCAIKTTLPSISVNNLDYAERVVFTTYFFYYFRLYGNSCLSQDYVLRIHLRLTLGWFYLLREVSTLLPHFLWIFSSSSLQWISPTAFSLWIFSPLVGAFWAFFLLTSAVLVHFFYGISFQLTLSEWRARLKWHYVVAGRNISRVVKVWI